ncbi:hypothetical protein FRB90_003758 [Tulasnella sp. 427]|nr:hypothetical protein FRB90_003758 [Tulasnella sp. 427]
MRRSAGGYGDVFKATLRASDDRPELLVAVKELRRAGDPVSRTRLAVHLARELRVWARLEHRNILELIGYHLNAQMTTALIVSPFMVNGNIIEYLEKAGNGTSDHQRLNLLIDVLNGLDYLHSSNPPICHADIKPENVLITDQIVAVLCDFGLARLDDETSSGLTTTKTIKGSARYMSPELLDEGGYHTLQSDMWAYGCLVLQVMTGVIPYSTARSDRQLIMMAVIQKKPPAALNGLDLPDPVLEPLLEGCWESGLHTTPDSVWEYEVGKNTDLNTIDDTREDTTEDEPGALQQSTSLTIPIGSADRNERLVPLPNHIYEIIPRLKALKMTEETIQHGRRSGGRAAHLQFSPDGRWLATYSWDGEIIIWKVEATLSQHRVLAHRGGSSLVHVAWSPNGKYLLSRTFRHVNVWVAKSGALKQEISGQHTIRAVTWMPSGNSFVYVEARVVYIMDLHGNIKADHLFEGLYIHGVGVTPDKQMMILVATLERPQDNLQPGPSESTTENRIIAYHLKNKKILCQVPLRKHVRDITISSDPNNGNGYLALVSYEYTAPLELWHVSAVAYGAWLQLVQTYWLPTTDTEFAGPLCFGGQQDQFVIWTMTSGKTYIWDRQTGFLLHSFQAANNIDSIPEYPTGVAWNSSATGRYMLALAASCGTVQIWTTAEE